MSQFFSLSVSNFIREAFLSLTKFYYTSFMFTASLYLWMMWCGWGDKKTLKKQSSAWKIDECRWFLSSFWVWSIKCFSKMLQYPSTWALHREEKKLTIKTCTCVTMFSILRRYFYVRFVSSTRKWTKTDWRWKVWWCNKKCTFIFLLNKTIIIYFDVYQNLCSISKLTLQSKRSQILQILFATKKNFCIFFSALKWKFFLRLEKNRFSLLP